MTTKGWIVTAIVVPLIVGYILLNVEYSFFSKKGDAVESLSIKAKKIVEQLEPINVENDSFIEPDIGSLQTLLSVANKINGSTERNYEYIKIIKLSLNEEKPGFAFTIAKNIRGSNERNDQYSNIIDKSLKLKKYALAMKVSEQVRGSTKRNDQYRKIIKAGMQERIDSINLENPETKTFKLDIPPSPRKLSAKMILTSLNRTSSDSNKITFIEENMQSMPNTITLAELNLMLNLISTDSYKTELTALLSQIISEEYTTRDYDKFTNQFSSDSYRNKATSILLQR